MDWFGPTDFLIMDSCGSIMTHSATDSPESAIVGGPIQQMKEECVFVDPATYASHTDPPFLIFHGDKDPLVPHCQSEHLYEQLQSVGGNSELIIIPGGEHGPGVVIQENYEKMVTFFKDQIR